MGWNCKNCGQLSSDWATECGRCETLKTLNEAKDQRLRHLELNGCYDTETRYHEGRSAGLNLAKDLFLVAFKNQ